MADNQARIILSARDDTKRAFSSVQSNFSKLQGLASSATLAFGGIGVAGAAAFAAIDSRIKKVANFQDISEIIGDTASNLYSLKTAADTTGISIDSIADFSVKLAKNLSKTDDESKGAGAALKALGLDLEAFKAASPVEQIELLSQALDKFADGQGKTQVLEAIARGGAQLIPLLKELNAQGGRQKKLTDEQIAQADQYADAQNRLRSQISQSADVIATRLTPAFIGVQDTIAETLKSAESIDFTNAFNKAAVAVEALSVVFVGRLAGSLVATSVAFTKATIESVRYQATLARMAGVSGVAAAATRGLGLAMGFLGGPIGILITALGLGALAFGNFGSKAAQAQKPIDSALEKLKQLKEQNFTQQSGGNPIATDLQKAAERFAKASGSVKKVTNINGDLVTTGLEEFKNAKADLDKVKAAYDEAQNILKNQETPATKPQLKFNFNTDKGSSKDKTSASRLQAAFDAESAQLKTSLDAQQQILEIANRSKLISEQAFYDAKLVISNASFDAETKALQNSLAEQQRFLSTINAKKDPDKKFDTEQKIKELNTQILAIEQKRAIANFDIQQSSQETARNLAEQKVERLKDIISQTPTAELERQRETIRELYEALGNGAITSADQFKEAVDVVLGRTKDLSEEATDDLTEFGKQAASNIQDSFAEFFFDPFKDGLGGLVENFEIAVRRMVANAAAAELAETLFGDLSKGGKSGGSGGGLFGDLFGSIFGSGSSSSVPDLPDFVDATSTGDVDFFDKIAGFFGGLFSANGNAFNQQGLVPFASGGVVNRATPFAFGGGKLGVMGEAGAEAILPLRRGANGRLGVELNAGSNKPSNNMTVVMNISTPDANSFRQSQGQILADAQRSLSRAGRNL